ncbi:hypothetical protein GOZ83_05310 [Agrobacterium vitis]|uniref:hypothetical protein n=1 Tax=Rhizobium/Agrobacterium group TaxID=227290 RepID=UPI0012E82254|nr:MULTISPECIES: hypothetical protein [Rhizobium/Agrobacterium group]MCF1492508.1 hypothetical protein [Allorhizobium ampelinum]MVA44500.1 hypothetical protein [Agrobacterium vitis]
MFKDLGRYVWECVKLAYPFHGKVSFVLGALNVIAAYFLSDGQQGVYPPLQLAIIILGLFVMNMFLFSPFRLYRQQKATIARLKYPLSISFENTDDYVNRNREFYGDDVVMLKLTAKRRMSGVSCIVKSVERKTNDGWGKPLNDYTQFALGMPYAEESWDRRDVLDDERIILFTLQNGHLKTFTKLNYLEFSGWKDSLPFGEYRFKLLLDAVGLDDPVRQDLHVKWTGKLDDLSIEIVDP